MGNRGNIVIRFNDSTDKPSAVWFYTHWSGTEIGQVVRNTLARRKRWDDPAYLARMIFDELTAGKQGKETGFGISTGMCDNEHDLLVIDTDAQTVRRVDSDDDIDANGQRWSFEEFASLSPDHEHIANWP